MPKKKPTGPKPTGNKLNDFLNEVNHSYEANVASIGSQFHALNVQRFSSGSVQLDCGLGGGWPFGRIVIIAGMESTGKTAIALKAMASVEDYDHTLKIHKDFMPAGSVFEKGRAAFFDFEGTFPPSYQEQMKIWEEAGEL